MKYFIFLFFIFEIHANFWVDFAYSNISSEEMAARSKSLYEDEPQEYDLPYVSVNGVRKALESFPDEKWVEIKAFSITGNNLDDKDVQSSLSFFIERKERGQPIPELLDLSYNHLTPQFFSDAIISLVQNQMIHWIDITGNSEIDNKEIIHIYRYLSKKLDKKAIFDVMSKIIFVKESYLEKASSTTQIYRNYVSQGYLAKDWGEVHSQYYKLKTVSELKKYNQYLASHGVNSTPYKLLETAQTKHNSANSWDGVVLEFGKPHKPIFMSEDEIGDIEGLLRDVRID